MKMSSIFAELNKINDNESIREERKILGESVDFKKLNEETNFEKLVKAFPELAEFEENSGKGILEESVNIQPIVDKIVTVIEKSGFTKRSISSTDSMITMENKDGSKTSYAVKIRMVPEFILEEELSGVVIKTTDKNQFIEDSAVTILNG